MEQVVWHKDLKLEHPTNGTVVFGYLDEIRVHRGPTFEPGPIHLKYGDHYGPSHGFGFMHLWKAHFPAVADHDEAMVEVRDFVAKSLEGPVTLYFERMPKVQAIRFNVGSLILQAYGSPAPHYSVVSGGYTQRGIGTKAGRVDPSRVSTLPANEKAP